MLEARTFGIKTAILVLETKILVLKTTRIIWSEYRLVRFPCFLMLHFPVVTSLLSVFDVDADDFV